MRPNDMQLAVALQVWVAALQEGYLQVPQLADWVERVMRGMDSPEAWAVALLDAPVVDSAVFAASKGLAAVAASGAYQIDHTSLRLGFMWLQHRRAASSLESLLQRAGDLADRANYDWPPCEEFYLLLNEIDGGGPVRYSDVPFETRTAEIFASHASRAIVALQALEPAPLPTSVLHFVLRKPD